jgi:phage repressor protein C with HTH and peptisase S24 domain
MLATRRAEYSILELCLPGRPAEKFGVLLVDPAADSVYQKLRAENGGEPEDSEVLAALSEDLAAKAREMGAAQLLELFEDSLSNTLRISDRRATIVRSFPAALDRLYNEHVLGSPRETGQVIPFTTHAPLYSLRAAAGRFGEDMEVEVEAEAEDWVRLPAGVHPSRDLYAAHVTGHSMEPEIPDGSIALFRYQPAGSRQGKRVLVWRRAASAGGGELTIKVYESEKRSNEAGWEHTRIRLKPLNPDYPVLELDDESEYRVLGELVDVLGIDEI